MERSKVIFGNAIAEKDYQKACRGKAKYQKKFGDDSGTDYYFATKENPVLAPIGVKNLVLTDQPGLELPENATPWASSPTGWISTPTPRPRPPNSSPTRTTSTPWAPG